MGSVDPGQRIAASGTAILPSPAPCLPRTTCVPEQMLEAACLLGCSEVPASGLWSERQWFPADTQHWNGGMRADGRPEPRSPPRPKLTLLDSAVCGSWQGLRASRPKDTIGLCLEPACRQERWSRAKTRRAKIILPLFLQREDTYCESHGYYAVRPLMASNPCFSHRFVLGLGAEPRHASVERAALGLMAAASQVCLSFTHHLEGHPRAQAAFLPTVPGG